MERDDDLIGLCYAAYTTALTGAPYSEVCDKLQDAYTHALEHTPEHEEYVRQQDQQNPDSPF